MHVIYEVFGEECDLYEILNCPKASDKAALRKAFYRTALKYHPDKNPNDPKAASTFQAVTAAYQILQDDDLRAAYDESGEIPVDDVDADTSKAGVDQWKDYFDKIFGRVTTSDIDKFAETYKCSDEEKRDVLKTYTARSGNLVQMIEFVMLSEPRDATRWVEDYIRPAIERGEVEDYSETLQKTLKKLTTQVEKEDAAEQDDDNDETETEDEEDDPPKRTSKKKDPPKKAKPTKKKKKNNDMSDLIAQIQNKRRGGGGGIGQLGARYGVSMAEDDDPLDDEAFAKIQSKFKKR